MRILITGANGFVGSHIAEYLLTLGNQVVCLVRKTSNLYWLKHLPVELKYGEICDYNSLINILKDSDIDVIIHSAGVLRCQDISLYYKVNQQGTSNLINAVKTYLPKLKKFIFISSQAAMGPSSKLEPKRLDEIENPISDYGKSKLKAEKEVEKLKGIIPYTIFRPSSVYGPRDKDLFIFFKLVHLGIKPITKPKRYIQLVYVMDIAKAVEKSINNSNTDNKIYVLAEDRFFSWDMIGDILSNIIEITTISIPLPSFAFYSIANISEILSKFTKKPSVLNRQKIEEMLQMYWLADSTPTKKDLNLEFTKFENGAKLTYQWYKENRWF